jgi:hypothetical protein
VLCHISSRALNCGFGHYRYVLATGTPTTNSTSATSTAAGTERGTHRLIAELEAVEH